MTTALLPALALTFLALVVYVAWAAESHQPPPPAPRHARMGACMVDRCTGVALPRSEWALCETHFERHVGTRTPR